MLYDDVKDKLVCGKCRGRQFGMTKRPAYDG
jgi:hypothetical protein